MKTLIELENRSIYGRFFSGFNISISLTLFIILIFWNQLFLAELYSFDFILILISPILSFLLFYLRQLKYYIIKIEVSEEIVYIEYFQWFTLKKDTISKTDILIKLEGSFPYGVKLVINNSGKILLQQYRKFLLSTSEWNDDILSSTFKELNEFIKDNH